MKRGGKQQTLFGKDGKKPRTLDGDRPPTLTLGGLVSFEDLAAAVLKVVTENDPFVDEERLDLGMGQEVWVYMEESNDHFLVLELTYHEDKRVVPHGLLRIYVEDGDMMDILLEYLKGVVLVVKESGHYGFNKDRMQKVARPDAQIIF